jgi:hypothetical protein
MKTMRMLIGGLIGLVGILGALFGLYMMSINGIGVILGIPLLLVCLIVIGVAVLVMR